MALEEIKMVIEQGATYQLPLRWFEDESKTTLRDLTGWTAAMQGRVRAEADETIFDLTSASEITLGDGTGTENITVVMSAAVTAALPSGCKGVFDLRLTEPDPSAVVWEVVDGQFVVKTGVTR